MKKLNNAEKLLSADKQIRNVEEGIEGLAKITVVTARSHQL